MSQRECAGFNWPPASIAAQEPVSISPRAVRRAGPGSNVNACSLNGLPRVCSARCARNSGEPLAECQSLAFGVAQPETNATVFRLLSLLPAALLPFRAGVPAIGVGHPVKHTAAARSGPWLRIASAKPPSNDLTPFAASAAVGVGHPVEPVADVRSTDARSRKRDRPDGVVHGFHVILYKVDPSICALARNLLSKNNCRSALADEVVPGWPQVPLVSKRKSFACLGERLARTGSCPHGAVIGPACPAQCQRPDADAGEEVVLAISPEVFGSHILNVSFVNIARRDVARGDQVAQPCGCIRIDLVVIGAHTPATHKGHRRRCRG